MKKPLKSQNKFKNNKRSKKTRKHMRKIKGGGEFIMPEIVIPNPEEINLNYGSFTDLFNLEEYKNFTKNNVNKRGDLEWGIDITHLLLNKIYDNELKEIKFCLYGLYYHDSKNPDEKNKKKLITYLKSIYKKKDEIDSLESVDFWNKSKYFAISRIEGVVRYFKLMFYMRIDNFFTYYCKKGFGQILICTLLNLFKTLGNITVKLSPAFGIPNLKIVYEKYGFEFKPDDTKILKEMYSTIDILLEKCSLNIKDNYGDIKLILKLENDYIDTIELLLDSLTRDSLKLESYKKL